MTPKISVIIPVYNGERFLPKAIESVARQTVFNELELILVDDGSTDDSGKICDLYSNKFSNIITLHCKNAGVSAARNAGIAHARGEHLAFLDSDDAYDESFLEKLLKHGACDLVCCDYYTEEACSHSLSDVFSSGRYMHSEFNLDFYKKIICKEFYSCWNKLYKRSLVLKNNITFPVGVKYAEDMMFVFEYLSHCKDFYFLDEALYFYNINPNNTTFVVESSYEVYKNIFEWQCEYFKSYDFFEEMYGCLRGNFVYNSICSINSESSYSDFFTAKKYTEKVLSDELFYKNYIAENYSEFKCTYDKVLHRLLRKKLCTCIVIWRKIFDLRSKLAHGSSD